MDGPSPLRTVFKDAPRKSQRATLTKLDYANLEANLPADPSRWLRVIETRQVTKDAFARMQAQDLDDEWLWSASSFLEPFIIDKPEGLGMQMPSKDIGIQEIAQRVGEHRYEDFVKSIS